MPTLSTQDYPFDDLWDDIEQVLDAFGTKRCLWGSDWTRVADFVTYHESLAWIRDTDRLSDHEKQQLLVTTASEVYGW